MAPMTSAPPDDDPVSARRDRPRFALARRHPGALFLLVLIGASALYELRQLLPLLL